MKAIREREMDDQEARNFLILASTANWALVYLAVKQVLARGLYD
jgi:hypothetical protein